MHLAIGAHGFEIDFGDALDGVAEELKTDGDAAGGGVCGFFAAACGREDVHDSAAYGEIAGFFDGIDARVTGGVEPACELGRRDVFGDAKDAREAVEAGRVGDRLHEGLDGRDNDGGGVETGEDLALHAEAFGEEFEAGAAFAGERFEGGEAERGDAGGGEFVEGFFGFVEVGDDEEDDALGDAGDCAGDEGGAGTGRACGGNTATLGQGGGDGLDV